MKGNLPQIHNLTDTNNPPFISSAVCSELRARKQMLELRGSGWRNKTQGISLSITNKSFLLFHIIKTTVEAKRVPTLVASEEINPRSAAILGHQEENFL